MSCLLYFVWDFLYEIQICQDMSFNLLRNYPALRNSMVPVGRSVRFRTRFGISVFSVSPGSLRGGAPQEFQEGVLGEGEALPPRNAEGF